VSRRTAGLAVALVLAGCLLAGCGDDGGGEMSERAADRLHEQVAAIQYAAAGEAYEPARQGLQELRSTVERLLERGDLSSAKAQEILEEAERVDQVLAELTAG
jgi:hypothetical protein